CISRDLPGVWEGCPIRGSRERAGGRGPGVGLRVYSPRASHDLDPGTRTARVAGGAAAPAAGAPRPAAGRPDPPPGGPHAPRGPPRHEARPGLGLPGAVGGRAAPVDPGRAAAGHRPHRPHDPRGARADAGEPARPAAAPPARPRPARLPPHPRRLTRPPRRPAPAAGPPGGPSPTTREPTSDESRPPAWARAPHIRGREETTR